MENMMIIIMVLVLVLVLGGYFILEYIKQKSRESLGKSVMGFAKEIYSSSGKDTKSKSKSESKSEGGEDLRTELLNKIDSMLDSSKEQFNTYLAQLHTGATLISSSKKKTEENVAKFKMEALEHKELYEKNGNELDKTKSIQYLKHLSNAESALVTLKLRGKEILEKLESTEFEQEDYIASLEHKKIEIISEIDPISNYKHAKFSIVELEKEFDDKIKNQTIENKANERISKMENEDVIPDTNLEKAFTKLK